MSTRVRRCLHYCSALLFGKGYPNRSHMSSRRFMAQTTAFSGPGGRAGARSADSSVFRDPTGYASRNMPEGLISRQSECTPPQPFEAAGYPAWMLDPQITYLNHGCFGARPRAVHEARLRRLAEGETRPIEWLDRTLDERLAEAKGTVGAFLGMQPADFGFVTNATGGVNAVLRSLTFEPGDELLTTNHVYNAVRQTMRYLAERAGAKHVEASVPLPLTGPDQIVLAIERAMTDRTRLLVLDHITSPTAVIFPLRKILELSASRGIDVLVDGAHAPGMVDLDVESLGAAYYTGNLHKWVCAPEGAAFLWVRGDRQRGIHPTTISHFIDEGMAGEFAWQGTRDITPWLTAADSIDWFEALGWDAVRAHNHQLAIAVQVMLSDRLGVPPSTPLDGSMIGSMTTIRLPDGVRSFESAESFQAALYDRYRIEVPIIDWEGTWWVRASCQVYNRFAEYERLADAVLELIEQGAE